MPEGVDPAPGGSAGFDHLARRLDRLHEAIRPEYDDDVFDLVEGLGRDGVGVGVAIVVDGITFVGAIGSSATFAAAVSDASTDAIADLDLTPDERDEIVGSFTEAEAQLWELIESRQAALDGYSDETRIDDLPVADAFDYFAAFRKPATVDLRRVRVHRPGSPPIEVDHVRLTRSRISAWWPLKAQGVEVEYVVRQADD